MPNAISPIDVDVAQVVVVVVGVKVEVGNSVCLHTLNSLELGVGEGCLLK